ncbi:MAG: nucleoside recognition domain-containing protein, partial [Bacteroidota bacterium]
MSKKEAIITQADQHRLEYGESLHDSIMEAIYTDASKIALRTVHKKGSKEIPTLDRTLDKLVTSKWLGFPIMFLMLALVFYLTVEGANYPSGMLASLLVDTFHPILKDFFISIGIPLWVNGLLIDGGYLAMAWVIAVMLPPMAIFFPIYTLLEDFGYLPRISFNMDFLYRKAGAHGKQALTTAMGFGCNAAGVVATRVIDSPREKLIAIITNNFSLCNGRWPTQILIASIFIGALAPAHLAGLVTAGAVVFVALLGIALSLMVSWGLSKTILKGEASAFTLELPPYRPPKLLQILYTSMIDRTIFILWRAILFAFPAGLVIWLVANVD